MSPKPPSLLAPVDSFFRWCIGFDPEVRPLRAPELHRLFFTVFVLFNIPALLINLYNGAGQGNDLRWIMEWVALLFCLVGFTFARMDRFHENMTRGIFCFFFSVIFVGIYIEQRPDDLIFLSLVPVMAIFLFATKEGLVWSSIVAAIATPAVIETSANELATTYVFLTMMSALLERLFNQAESQSLRRSSAARKEQRQLVEAQKELAQSETRFRNFSELASDWLFEMDRNLVYTFATPRLYEILGGSVEGQNVSDLAIELEGDGSALAPMRNGEEISNQQVSFRNFDGDRVVALFSAKPVFDEYGEFNGYIGAGKDITNFKQAEEELRLKDQTIHHQQKLEALGQLTSGVAHDFNNLMTIVGGNLELLEQVQLEEADRGKVEASMRAVNRASELTQQLLSFSRKQDLDPMSVRVDGVFTRLSNMFDRTMEGSVTIVKEVSDDLWLCHADEGQLENAILNLALNARDSMSGRGQITLAAENFQQTETDRLPAGDYVRISVSDTGSGISEEELTRIMEPFYTTKPVGEGTGLGLSMVYGFAQQSDGDLEATSTVGVGSCFSLLLPRGVQVDELPNVFESREDFPFHKHSVMVVDDDEDVLNVIQMSLEKVGINVLTAANAEQALDVIYSGAKPHLLISDLMLGQGMNGADLLTEATQMDPSLSVLLISGNADHLLSVEELRYHSTNLLRKPFNYQQLMDAVRIRLPAL